MSTTLSTPPRARRGAGIRTEGTPGARLMHVALSSTEVRARVAEGSVVVAFDGSGTSRAALQWAARTASALRTSLAVVHTAYLPGIRPSSGRPLLHLEPGALDAVEELTAEGAADAAVQDDRLAIQGITAVTRPVDALVAASRPGALLVVGAGRSASVARPRAFVRELIRASECPVVVVPADAEMRPRGRARPLVVGVHLADPRVAVRFAAELASRRGLGLEVVLTRDGQEGEVAGHRVGQLLDLVHGAVNVTGRPVRADVTFVEGSLADALRPRLATAELLVVDSMTARSLHGRPAGWLPLRADATSCPIAVVGPRTEAGPL